MPNWTATHWTALVVAGFLAGVLTGAPSASAATGRADADKPAVQAVSYNVGKSGSRLKWVSRRPESAQSAEPDASCEPSDGVRTVQDQQPIGNALGNGVLGDAFGDKKKSLAPTTPKKNKNGTKPSLLEQELASRQYDFKEGCPSPKDLKNIQDLNTDISPSEGELPRDCPLGDDVFQPRSFASITYTWTASGLCHKPLYFEDVQLERYGHMAGPWLQPFASGAHFFLTIPILPYKMGLEPPNECIYTLGYYRPGSCAPYLFDPLPISVRGLFFEGGAWVGACALFP